MKRRFTILTAALALLTFLAVPMGMWGQTRESETITFADLGLENGVQYTDPFGTNISVTFAGGDNDGKYYTTGSGIRTYGDGTITITANDNTVTAISTTFSGGSYAPASTDVWSCNGTTTNSTSGVNASWSGSATEVVMTRPSGSGHWRMQAITVTYTAGGSTPTTYNVTVNQTTGGTIAANPTQATAGTIISLTATPAEGYNFDLWSITPNTVVINNNQFTMPASDVTVSAQWTAIPTPQGGTDELTNDNTIGETTSTYKDWTTSAFTSGAVYKGNSAGSNGTIQLRTNNSNSGIVSTTSGGKVTKVVVTWNSSTSSGRTLDIYGKNTAYEAPTDLYYSSKQGTKLGSIVYGTSTTLTITGDYNYIGLRSNSGAMYLDQVAITWGSASSLSAPAISPTQLTFVDSQEISITAPEGASVRYTLDGSEPTATTGTLYTEPFTISNTTIVKAIAYTETAISEVTTVTYTRVYTITLNQTTGGTISASPAQAAAGATITLTATPNVGYTFGTWSVTPSVTLNGDSFTMPANNVTVSATFTASSSYTVSFSVNNKVEMTATTFGGSIDLTKFVAEAQGYQFNGWSETATGSIVANPTSYTPQADITLYAQFGEIVSNGYTLVTNVNQLVAGNQVVIAANGSKNVAMSTTQNDNNRGVAIITKNNDNTISFDEEGDINGEVVCQFTLGTSNGHWTFYDAGVGYLYAPEGNKNYLRTQSTNDANGEWNISISNSNDATITAQGTNTSNKVLKYNSSNSIFSCYTSGQQTVWLYTKTAAKRTRESVEATSKVTDITDDVLVTVKNGGIVYLTGGNAGNESNLVVEDGGQLVASANVKGTMLKTITGYGSTTTASNYYFISTPLTQSTNPQNVKNMINADGGYDLYYFNQNPANNLEWRNYKVGNGFSLIVGSGYLYANSESVDLEFAGNLRKSTDEETYDKDIAYEGTQAFAGWNLVGNPFTTNAIVNKPYYKMNDSGSGISVTPMTANGVIATMEGVFVKATEGESDENVTFTATTDDVTTQGSKGIVLEVNRDNKMLDRTIVNVNQGGMLSKLRLSAGVTELYIPQDDEDYAIVRSEAQGELPVSFRAGENGTYTLSMNVENVDMNYLHLIDNMTGMDVDLLQTPSYTFEANTNDYANRFKLVFAANGTDEADESSFAFFSNGNLIVNNEGNATLQVIDINGRILSSETISGSCSKAINATTGVYMLRLINGENVKVQKVVVR